MNTQLLIGVIAVLLASGVLMAVMQYAAVIKFPERRIRPPRPNKVTLKTKVINVIGNMAVALILIFGSLYLGKEQMVSASPVAWYMVVVEALAVLLLYDFMYYFFHRGMHYPKVMKYCHGVHHYIRHPTAFESIYVHPLEGIGGVGLLLLSVFIFGLFSPISIASFVLMLLIYNFCNILVHTNITWESKWMWLANYWAKRHDIHHGVHLNRNYSSIFPFWDMMFKTYA
ncbi:MAG: sterol desaturase family protein [Pseudomonadales bacterium]|nr:sterol desaturase family protein [Pseudomonadales bacterium]